jgi:hypothetical protein
VRSESYNGVDVVERFIGVSAPDARDRDGKWLEVRAPEAPPTPRRSCSDRAAFHRGASAGADVWWHVACHDASASFRRGGARAIACGGRPHQWRCSHAVRVAVCRPGAAGVAATMMIRVQH